MKPIHFGAGTVRCRTCGAVMRPTRTADGWPRDSVVYGAKGECVNCASEDNAPPSRPTDVGRPPSRRRPRRRFDYRPEALAVCESCGKRYDPMDGTCGCNDKP